MVTQNVSFKAPPVTTYEPQKSKFEVKEERPNNDSIRTFNLSRSFSEHTLTSTVRGESSIEKLAEKIETRRANRIPVTVTIRKLFLKTCRKIAKETGQKNRILHSDLITLRDNFKAKVEEEQHSRTRTSKFTMKIFRFSDQNATMLELLEKAIADDEELDSEWFYFRDFNFYHTKIVKSFPFSNSTVMAMLWLLLFYFFSVMLFCGILEDDGVCPIGDRPYEGWLTSVYFASVTMSTVGYGDVTFSGSEKNWHLFVGTLYMLLAVVMGYTVFASAANLALRRFQIHGEKVRVSALFQKFVEKFDESSNSLRKHIWRVVYVRLAELAFYFFALNMIGAFVARFFVRNSQVEGQQWTWMMSLYWAVQTTTTIGYGDLETPFELRWFQIFYTTLGTAFVGSIFAGIANLKRDISDLKKFYAWKRREISKRLIEDMKGLNLDEKVDQFEFMVGSLLMLNKIERSDVEQIMDKYRELAGNKGFIVYSDAKEEAAEIEHRSAQEGLESSEDADLACDLDADVQVY